MLTGSQIESQLALYSAPIDSEIEPIMQPVHTLAPLCLSALLSLFPKIGFGMDVSVEYINPIGGHHGQYPTLVLRGEIKPGDYDRLFEYVTKNNVDLNAIMITLASPGGDVSEALKLGQLFKSIFARVAVGPATGRCASACFILYASAVYRASAPGFVGIHRPYVSRERLQTLSPSAAEALETSALSAAEGYLHELRVPSSIVDVMFENASTEIHWLDLDELRMLGERPAWYEEFLIARCGLDKDAEMRFRADPDDRTVAKELMDVYGCEKQLTRQEAVDALTRATAAYYKTRPPGEEEQDRKRNSSRAATYADLDREVPSWRQINTDKAFLAWIANGNQKPPTAVGTQEILVQAFEANERALVVAIFKEYVQQLGATTAEPAPSTGHPLDTPPPGRWLNFAETTDASGQLTTHGTWDLDRDSVKRGPGAQFSFDVRTTVTNEGAPVVPQLRRTLSLMRWSLDCTTRTYADYGGTVAYLDNGKWVPGPLEGSGNPIAASSTPRAAQLIDGACAALTGR